MIKEYSGNIFNVGAECIVNTVNTEGFMGAGIAYEVKLRYPNLFKEYEESCKKGNVEIGKLEIYREEDIYIVNFPTKTYWRLDSQYIFIEKGLEFFLREYDSLIKKNNIKSIAFPKLGAGKGGLDWPRVRELMYKYLSEIEDDLDIYICLDDIDCPEGVEKSMVHLFNSLDEYQLSYEFKLNNNQMENILLAIPIRRIFEIRNIGGIGKKSYERIHRILYKKALTGEEGVNLEQLNFLD